MGQSFLFSMFHVGNFLNSVLLCTGLRSSAQRWSSTNRSATKFGDIVALDFDGVVCASANESSITAMLTARRLWTTSVPRDKSLEFGQICAALTSLRPIVETGYEIVILARLLSDIFTASSSKAADTSFDTIAAALHDVQSSWSTSFRDGLIGRYETSKDTLVSSFGDTRDNLIHGDPSHWANLNPFYTEVCNALTRLSSNENLFIVTTKKERFVRLLLQHNRISHLCRGTCGGNSVRAPVGSQEYSSNIFDLNNRYGSKSDVLRELSRRQLQQRATSAEMHPPTIHFVEDRYETLLSVLAQRSTRTEGLALGDLSHVRLYLADWGYNTAEQRAAAAQNPDIAVISQQQLAELIQTTTSAP